MLKDYLCPSWTTISKKYFRHRRLAIREGLFRKWHECRCRVLSHKCAASVPVSKNINEFEAPHGLLGIVINKNATIGTNCIIFQYVTIGQVADKNSKIYGSPIIGNNVFIGAGAKIIGGIKVGNNVKIGAGAIVVEDIPDNSTVVAVKPRIILEKN